MKVMKSSTRIGLVYAMSLGAAAFIAYSRGKRGWDIATDTLVIGGTIGTGANVVLWLVGETNGMGEQAQLNGVNGMGVLSKEAIKVLANVNVDQVYEAVKQNGVKIGPVPADESIINQDNT